MIDIDCDKFSIIKMGGVTGKVDSEARDSDRTL